MELAGNQYSLFPAEDRFNCGAGLPPGAYLRKTNEFMAMFFRGVSGSSGDTASSASEV